jgi:hypothetical protein
MAGGDIFSGESYFRPPPTAPAATPTTTTAAPVATAASPPPAPTPAPKTPDTFPGESGFRTQASPPAAKEATPQQTGGGQQQPAGPGWGIDWNNPWSKGGPALTAPQSVTDWNNIAGNEAFAGTIPGLRAAAEEARKRAGPLASGSADFVGGALSPTNALYAVPYAGPGLAGGLHAALKSYNSQPNWVPDQAGAKKIAEDTAVGTAAGYGGTILGKAAPVVAPWLARGGVTLGGPLAGGWLGHTFVGGGDLYRELANATVEMAGLPGYNEAGKWAQEATKNVINSPVAQQAIRNLTLGGTAALRAASAGPPPDQW